MPSRILLTFDVEDFINAESLTALRAILKLLEKYNLKGIFFITGHMTEKIALFSEITRLLRIHEIGFHSSSHSVHPTIFEYCDVEKYEDAYRVSLERETSHIDPLSGAIEGDGGLLELRKLFPSKNIQAYRAPGYCCPPPNLDAIMDLGLTFDFSWNFSKKTVSYKGITFYPRPFYLSSETAFLTGESKTISWAKFLRSTIEKKTIVLNFHPSFFVNEVCWDTIYYKGNPAKLSEVQSKPAEQTRVMLSKLEMLLRTISYLEKLGVINTSPDLTVSKTSLDVTKIDFIEVAEALTYWPRTFFAYEPKHIHSQLIRFLGRNQTSNS